MSLLTRTQTVTCLLAVSTVTLVLVIPHIPSWYDMYYLKKWQSAATLSTSTINPPRQAPAGAANRAVVCLTGIFRGGQFTLPLLRRNVLDALGMPFDVVLATPDEQPPGISVDEILNLLPNLRTVLHPDYGNVSATAAALNFSRTALVEGTVHNPSKWLSQLTDLSACNDAIRQTGMEYTHAVRVRADALVMDPLPMPLATLPPKHVVVPDNEEYQGVNDRFAYGRIEDMSVLFDLLHAVPGLLLRAPAPTSNELMWNAEKMYGIHGADYGISFDKLPIQLCRIRSFTDGVLSMDAHDAETYSVCRSYCSTELPSCN